MLLYATFTGSATVYVLRPRYRVKVKHFTSLGGFAVTSIIAWIVEILIADHCRSITLIKHAKLSRRSQDGGQVQT
jgi:hypothetical protein